MIDSTKKKTYAVDPCVPESQTDSIHNQGTNYGLSYFSWENQVYQHVMENDVTLGDGWCLKNGLQRPLLS